MNKPQEVSREQWLAERKELLAREKQLTRTRDAMNADRRRLPMVAIGKDYVFEGPDGRAGLSQLFGGRRQLIVQHVMFGPDAEQNLRAALAADPHNVYASAMLGNWTLQNGGNIADAVQFFNTAVATGKARPFVRTLQLAGLVDRDVAGARNAVMQAANDMRRSGEPLDPDTRRRVVTFCCDLNLNNHVELAESLAAIPQDDAWSTYLWLDGSRSDHDAIRLQSLQHAFI